MVVGKDGKAIHSSILNFVTWMLEDLGSSDGCVHASYVVERCMHFFRRFELAAVKSLTISPVLLVLDWQPHVLTNIKMDPSAIALCYQREFSVNRKLTPSCRGAILQVCYFTSVGCNRADVSDILGPQLNVTHLKYRRFRN